MPSHPSDTPSEAVCGACIRLRSGSWVAEVLPAIGGSLAGFWTETHDGGPHHWLRPATAEAIRQGDPLGMASFPLLPWCNRIRDGVLRVGGQAWPLASLSGLPHALHGVGWRLPWEVVARGAEWVELRLQQPAGPAWPFAFEAQQRYRLGAEGLSITVALRNTGGKPMPAGIGHHPYLPHRREGGGTRLQAGVQAMWTTDAACLPTGLVTDHPAVAALRAGTRLADWVLDQNFAGFDGRARVCWPDGSGLRLRAEPVLGVFVLYSPAGEDHFVMEAVSSATDWLNLRAADPQAPVGGTFLAPGEVLQATTTLEPWLAS